MSDVRVHASCVQIAGAGAAFGAPADAGVLLLGESGAGKSELALQLIERGAILVADDQAELFVREDRLWARPPAPIAGLIELREVGVVTLPHAAESRIGLAVVLEKGARYPERERYILPMSLNMPADFAPPLLRISTGLAAAAKILLAVAAFEHSLHREGLLTI